MLEFDRGGYECICIFARRTSESEGWICLEGPSGKEQQIHMEQDWYRRVLLALPEEGIYRISQEGVCIVQLYLSGGQDLGERGVRFLDTEDGTQTDLAEWYDSPYREQYHFAPFMNWVNDPNGLCWFKGYYHLFYQSNPFGQEWNDMYWGHAVSRDLVRWTHMPHVLEPQPSLWRDRKRKGGAFSGSAQVSGDRMYICLTRHDGPLEDGEDTREWQTEAVCVDGIHVEEECPCIAEKPAGVSFDFRDPKIQNMEGKDYMVLGAALEGVPSILLYGRENGTWLYKGPLLQEYEPGIRTFECPDFFELDGKHVAAGAWMCHRDREGRYQMTRCYIGTFDGRECYGLAKERILEIRNQNQVKGMDIPGNSFLVKIWVKGEQDFRVIAAREGKDTLSLVRRNGITGLVSTRKEVEGIHFPSDIRNVRYAELFVDRRVTEVYLNHGESAGTKLFYQEGSTGYLEAEFEEGGLERLEVWTMESIWNHKA